MPKGQETVQNTTFDSLDALKAQLPDESLPPDEPNIPGIGQRKRNVPITPKDGDEAFSKLFGKTPEEETKAETPIANEEVKEVSDKKKTRKKKTKRSKQTDDITVSIRAKLPAKLDFDLTIAAKTEYKAKNISKSDLIAIACQYFLDTYENPDAEDGIEDQYLELVGKS